MLKGDEGYPLEGFHRLHIRKRNKPYTRNVCVCMYVYKYVYFSQNNSVLNVYYF